MNDKVVLSVVAVRFVLPITEKNHISKCCVDDRSRTTESNNTTLQMEPSLKKCDIKKFNKIINSNFLQKFINCNR